MQSQNDRGGNYLKFDYFVRENHKPEGKLMGRAGNEEYCEKGEGVQFLRIVSEVTEEVPVTSSSKFIAGLQ